MPKISPLPPSVSEKDKSRTLRELGMFLYVFVVFFFWIFAIFSNRGFAGNFQLRAVASEARTQHEEASVENDALRNSIHSLKNDDAAIEKIAREKLRMVKPGETVYIFHDK